MSIDILHVDRHTCSILNQVTSLYLVLTQFYKPKRIKVYVVRDTVCQSRYSMSIEVLYIDRLLCLTVCVSLPVRNNCRSTYSMSINIQYLDRHTVCQSRYRHVCMSIDIHAQYLIRLPHCI